MSEIIDARDGLIEAMDNVPRNIKAWIIIEDTRAKEMVRINRGFVALELLGLCHASSIEIIEQMRGRDAPEVVSKVVIEPLEAPKP